MSLRKIIPGHVFKIGDLREILFDKFSIRKKYKSYKEAYLELAISLISQVS